MLYELVNCFSSCSGLFTIVYAALNIVQYLAFSGNSINFLNRLMDFCKGVLFSNLKNGMIILKEEL